MCPERIPGIVLICLMTGRSLYLEVCVRGAGGVRGGDSGQEEINRYGAYSQPKLFHFLSIILPIWRQNPPPRERERRRRLQGQLRAERQKALPGPHDEAGGPRCQAFPLSPPLPLQEPSQSHLHLHPTGHICVCLCQCRLCHCNVPPGAAGIKRSRCDFWREAPRGHGLDHAHFRRPVHIWRSQWVPLHLLPCISTLLMLVTSDMYTLINYVGFINYFFYGVTIAGQIVLRWKKPDIPRPIKVNLLFPIIYLLFWAFLLVFSLWSEPVVCGTGLAIMLTGVPVYFLGVYWQHKPRCFNKFIELLTLVSQKMCMVVYPKVEEDSGTEELHEDMQWQLQPTAPQDKDAEEP
ncbi:large neutral amino acids transporter small subunit 2 isoform X1 [Physeter macrocephalus]|uniref:Large neutral amino acids transporter small subunit 2 isoform X1 n=1 Tax=Physeter macrocephalus TaxID=9755 RepID=A0A455ASV8_PHYMC|nr:large neutral amino acids transporter small subunit 2 isoform X1 [Physeter catodon]|eukprot:XP_028339662.1 large neutral amino acids transporter small subunit 2 isoform X1 [Physeter catodon]